MVIGILGAVFGIALLFLLAAPRMRLGKKLLFAVSDNGLRRYNLTLVSHSWLRLLEVRVRAALIVPTSARFVRVPIPLSSDEWFVLKHKRQRSPRLLLDQVDWQGYLPSSAPEPSDTSDLDVVMRELGAWVVVEVIASTEIFQVRSARVGKYTRDDFDAGEQTEFTRSRAKRRYR